VESKDDFSQTPPLLAAGRGHEAIVKLLLEKITLIGRRVLSPSLKNVRKQPACRGSKL
jgi:hypothetical protein